MILAGDLGGTKTLLGLFERAQSRPHALVARGYPTQEFDSFTAILDAFAREVGEGLAIDAAAVGVAGPIVDQHAKLTNIAWDVSAKDIGTHLNVRRVALLNDLEAMATSVALLEGDEVVMLQRGQPKTSGNAAVIAAGTGLGQAYLHRVNGRLLPVASEGGHADFAPRTDREFELVRMLRDLYGRAEVEQVISGPGLLNIHRLTHAGKPCASVKGITPAEQPAAISEAALSQRCARCGEALEIFVEAYGAEAGNLALRGVATAGVYVGGGIAPKILPMFDSGLFLDAFRAKEPLSAFVATIPVAIILNSESGLLGAAVHANAAA